MRLWRAAILVLGVAAVTCVATPTPPSPTPAATVAPSPPAPRAVDVRVIGPAGTGVGGATVCATRSAGEAACAETRADGHADVRVLPGVYWLRARAPSGARLADGVAVVDLTEATDAVVTLEGRATISGTVRDDGGAAVANAEVCAHATTSEEIRCERTRRDGAYAVEVEPGIHKVHVAPPAASRLMPDWATGDSGSAWQGGQTGSDVALAADTRARDATGVDVTLLRGVALSGLVTAAADGRPVKEAQVCTYPFRAPLGWDCGATDKNGRYVVVRVPDDYWIWVIPPGERGSRLMYQRYDRVLEGFAASPFDLHRDATLDVALTDGVVLRGRVTTTDGTPVVLAYVCLDTPFPTGRICRVTGTDGSYEIATRPETYVVSVVAPEGSDLVGGFWPDAAPDWTKATPVRVGTGGAALDLALAHGVRLEGTIRDARGVPLEGATVNVNTSSGPRFFASTDLRGRYAVAVTPGSYTVDVFVPLGSATLSLVGQRIDATGDVGYDVALPDLPPEAAGAISGP